MGQGAVTWSSKKQHIIALLSTEAKYIMQMHAVKEALWIRMFIGEFCEGFTVGQKTVPMFDQCVKIN